MWTYRDKAEGRPTHLRLPAAEYDSVNVGEAWEESTGYLWLALTGRLDHRPGRLAIAEMYCQELHGMSLAEWRDTGS